MTWEVWCHCFWLFTLLATGGRHRRSVFTLNSLHRFRLNEIRSKCHLLFDVFKKKKTKKSQKSLTTRSKSEVSEAFSLIVWTSSVDGDAQLSLRWFPLLLWDFGRICGWKSNLVLRPFFFCQTGIFKVFNLKQAKCF